MDSSATPSQLVENALADEPSFLEIHRDVWRIIRLSPGPTLVFPVLLMLLPDLVGEIIWKANSNQGLMGQISVYWKTTSLLGLIVQSLSYGVALSAVKRVHGGESPRFGECYYEGMVKYWKVVFTTILMNIRVAVGTLLLVVPGVILSVQYVLALPAIVLGGYAHGEALKRSAALVKGRWWTTLGKILLAALIYGPWALLPSFMLAERAPVWQHALGQSLTNIFLHAMIIGAGVLYLRRAGFTSETARGEVTSKESGGSRITNSRGLTAFALVGWMFFMSAGIVMPVVADYYATKGAEAIDSGAFEQALASFSTAQTFANDDPTIGLNHAYVLWLLDRSDESLGEVEELLKDNPSDPSCLYLKTRILMEFERFQEAEGVFRELLMSPALMGSGIEAAVEELLPYFDKDA